MVTILITPERPGATSERCAALSWTLRGRLRNGYEWSGEKMMNKEKRVDGGLGHVEGDDEDRRLGRVGKDRAVLS